MPRLADAFEDGVYITKEESQIVFKVKTLQEYSEVGGPLNYSFLWSAKYWASALLLPKGYLM